MGRITCFAAAIAALSGCNASELASLPERQNAGFVRLSFLVWTNGSIGESAIHSPREPLPLVREQLDTIPRGECAFVDPVPMPLGAVEDSLIPVGTSIRLEAQGATPVQFAVGDAAPIVFTNGVPIPAGYAVSIGGESVGTLEVPSLPALVSPTELFFDHATGGPLIPAAMAVHVAPASAFDYALLDFTNGVAGTICVADANGTMNVPLEAFHDAWSVTLRLLKIHRARIGERNIELIGEVWYFTGTVPL